MESNSTTTRSAKHWPQHPMTCGTLLLAMSAAACAANDRTAPPSATTANAAADVRQLTQRDDGTTVRLRVGDSIAIVLPENPTTGYTWSVASTGDAPLKAAPVARERSSNAPGAGGQVTFTFVAQAQGEGRIALVQARPWEDPGAAIGHFYVDVQVTR